MPGARRTARPVLAVAVIGVRCGGSCLPAGAGVLTWWRRRARRAPARQGAAAARPEVGELPASPPVPGWSHVVASHNARCARASASETGQGRTARRAEGVPLKT